MRSAAKLGAGFTGLDLRARWLTVLSLAGSCVLPAAVRYVCYPGYPGSDDAFIHLAVVQNVVSGNGWGINPGHPVNMSTSPMFTFAFAVLSRWVDDILSVGQTLSVMAVMFSIALTFHLVRRLSDNPSIALLAAALAASNIHLWRWTGTFLETTFAYGYVLVLMFVALRRRGRDNPPWRSILGSWGFGALVGIGVLLRPETGLVGIAWFVHELLNRRLRLAAHGIASLLGLTVALAPYVLWAQATFGHVIPTTLAAKAHGGIYLGASDILVKVLAVWGFGAIGSALLIAYTSLRAPWDSEGLHRRDGLISSLGRLTILWMTPLLVTVFFLVKTEQLQSPGRYLLPFMGTVPVLAAVLWRTGEPSRQASGQSAWGIAGVAVALQLVSAFVINQSQVAPVLRRMNTEYVATMSGAAQELNRHCRPGDTVLVWADIGVVSWRHDKSCFIADAGALASPELAKMELSEMIEHTGARFVLECQGMVDEGLSFPKHNGRLLWSRPYLSQSVASPEKTFVARLYELDDSTITSPPPR